MALSSQHLQSRQHQEFLLDFIHCAFLDSIISQLSSDFVPPCTPLLRYKYDSQGSADHLVSLENLPCLLKEQNLFHLTVISMEMTTTLVPFASDTHEKGGVAADTCIKTPVNANLMLLLRRENSQQMLPCKCKHPYGQYGQVKKRQTLISDKSLPNKNLFPTDQQVEITGHLFPSQFACNSIIHPRLLLCSPTVTSESPPLHELSQKPNATARPKGDGCNLSLTEYVATATRFRARPFLSYPLTSLSSETKDSSSISELDERLWMLAGASHPVFGESN
ncbi:hypothetical protein E2320_002608 [Naja naja]|nr:hypothetical protein E2320_002608 [Naja naja]